MEVFTQGWNHRPYSPTRFDDACDFHGDGPKMLIALRGQERPLATAPSQLHGLPIVADAMSDDVLDGEIDMFDFIRLLSPYACKAVDSDRKIKIGAGAFDARQIFDFCLAVIQSDVIGWRVQKNKGLGFTLFLAGLEWVGAVASFADSSDGAQVLP